MSKDILINAAKMPGKIIENKKQAWSDLVREYPDKWIIYTEQEIVPDDRAFLCRVLAICTNEERGEKLNEFLDTYKEVGSMRTTFNFNGAMGL